MKIHELISLLEPLSPDAHVGYEGMYVDYVSAESEDYVDLGGCGADYSPEGDIFPLGTYPLMPLSDLLHKLRHCPPDAEVGYEHLYITRVHPVSATYVDLCGSSEGE